MRAYAASVGLDPDAVVAGDRLGSTRRGGSPSSCSARTHLRGRLSDELFEAQLGIER